MTNNYVRLSDNFFSPSDNFVALYLETHLFFGRIMKEHSLFLMAGFQPPNGSLAKKADWYRSEFESLLWQVVSISDGMVSKDILESGEIVTDFTLKAERSTSRLTGISIETCITQAEKRLQAGCMTCENERMNQKVQKLNERAICLIGGLIDFKEEILKDVTTCQIFTANYPLLIKHIIREAKLYHTIITQLNEQGCITSESLCSMESFWNQIMMEHALFIRGLLDPSEEELIKTADEFAQDYRALLNEARRKDCETMDALTRKTLEETIRYRDFKAAGTMGITECKIASIILPLLADHVLREANHYLRILEQGRSNKYRSKNTGCYY